MRIDTIKEFEDELSEHNDDDMWDINYCPICGKKLKEGNNEQI